jgi:paraquat-inducible protein B
MTDHDDLDNVPQAIAVPKKRKRFSVVWIIPVVAVLVALGIWVQRIMSEGPTITIIFKEATGIEAGKTFVRYKDVHIGLVKTMKLSEDFTKVVVTAKIDKSAKGLIVEDTKFWIEQPRASLSGISGIGTLLSGNYIGLEPGKSKRERRDFAGLEVPPAITFDQPGRRFVLQTNSLGSIGSGAPLYYRQLNVGQVIGYDLAEDGGSIKIEVFVRAPYDKYVTDQTRFWHASGIDVSLGAEGFSVRTQSVLSMLIGGIAFETFTSAAEVKPAAEKAVFTLYNDRKAAMAHPETIVTPYVLYPDESLRGLLVGAPVTYLGLPVGEVTAVGLEYKPETEDIRPRVDFVIYLRRLLSHLKDPSSAEEITSSKKERHAFIQGLVNRGFRAQLRSGSLLTGQLYVALDIFPNAAKVKIDWTKTPQELPVVPSGLQDIQNKVNNILAKIEKMPIDAIGEDLRTLLARLDGLLKRAEGEILPDVKKTLEDLQRVLKSTDATLVGKDARAQQDLREALQEISRAAKAISGLIDYLERNPDALIRGKTQEKSR